MGDITKNQHLVPQLVIRKFSDDGENIFRIREIRTNKGIKKEINKKGKGTASVMYREFAYEFPSRMIWCEDDINYIEKSFSEIETYYKDKVEILINMLENKEPIKEIQKFIENEILFTAIMFYLRSAKFMCVFSEVKEDKTNEEDIKNKRIEKIMELAFNPDYINKFKKTIIRNYKFHILESLDNAFFLSDSFMCTASYSFKGILSDCNCTNRSVGIKDILILIPISSKYYILYTDNDSHNKLLNNRQKVYLKDIKYYNSIIYRNSYEFTVGKKEFLEQIKNSVKKYLGPAGLNGRYILPREIWVDEIIDYYFSTGQFELLDCNDVFYYGFYESPIGYYNLDSKNDGVFMTTKYEEM